MAQGELYELRVGVFATSEGLQQFVHDVHELLGRERAPGVADQRWKVSVARGPEPAWPGMGEEPSSMTVDEFYDELPQQWDDEHPGETPGDRFIAQVRVGVVTDAREELQEAVRKLLCQEYLHPGPCPIPWSADYRNPEDREERAYLERAYGDLEKGWVA